MDRILSSRLEIVLKELGVVTSEPCTIRESCFEYAARRGSNLILLKIATNLAEVTRGTALELSLIAEQLSAAPLVLGQSTLKGPMEDGIAYKRYGIFAITLQTLSDVMSDGEAPLVEANPGGFFVTLDTEKLLKKREELELSRKELASIVGTSSKALYAYERGLAKCTISVALRLERILGVPIVRRLELFKQRYISHRQRGNSNSRGMLQRIIQKLIQLRLDVTVTRKAPFDFIMKDAEGNAILGGVIRSHEVDFNRRIRIINSVAKVAIVPSIIIAENRIDYDKAITWDKLERIQEPADLSSFL